MKISFLFISLFLIVSIKGQTVKEMSPTKIAIINTNSFHDEKTGILKLAKAETLILSTDCGGGFRYVFLVGDIKKLEKEIAVLEYQKAPIEGKLKRLDELTSESYKALAEERECKADIRKHNIDPLIESINKKLQEFAQIKGYDLVIDASAIIHSSIQFENLNDVTVEFIKYCNDFFDKDKSQ